MIKLDNEYYLTADQYNVVLKRKYRSDAKPIKGEKRELTEDTVGYFSTISAAVMAYRRVMTREWIAHDNVTLAELYEKLVKLDQKILKNLPDVSEPILDKTNALDTKLAKERQEEKPKRTKKGDAQDAG